MLINCVAYQDGARLADLQTSEISDYLDKPGCFVWVALRDATDAELDEMRREFNLHELAVEDARHGHQRPKIEEYGDSLFAVLHTIEREKDEAGDEVYATGEVDIFVGPNYVLTVRHRTQVGFAAVRARSEREPELLAHGSGYVFYAVMDNVVDRYFPIIDSLETELESIEEQIPAVAKRIPALEADQIVAWPAVHAYGYGAFAEILDDLTTAVAAADPTVGDA